MLEENGMEKLRLRETNMSQAEVSQGKPSQKKKREANAKNQNQEKRESRSRSQITARFAPRSITKLRSLTLASLQKEPWRPTGLQ